MTSLLAYTRLLHSLRTRPHVWYAGHEMRRDPKSGHVRMSRMTQAGLAAIPHRELSARKPHQEIESRSDFTIVTTLSLFLDTNNSVNLQTITMADAAPRGGGFGSRGDRGGDRGRGGRGRGRPRRGGNKSDEKEWQPVTKLGRLVKAGKIKSMEEIYLHSLPIKEYQIVDFFLPKLKDEVMKVRSHTILEVSSRRELFADSSAYNRSSPSRSRPVPVSVPASKPLWLLATARDTSVLALRPPRKSPPPSVPPSSLPSSPLCPFAVVTGVPTSVSRTPFPSRNPASVAPSPFV